MSSPPPPPASAAPSQPQAPRPYTPPLHLTIRFSTSQPDIDLDIPSPQSTTVLALKHLLRSRLSSRSRLRLIHQGRLLPDTAALAHVLKAPLAPPPVASASASSAASPSSSPPQDQHDPKGKGKAVEGTGPVVRVYVNCSIGDELSPEELAAEESAAANPPDDAHPGTGASKPASSTRPRPRGFDRLLQAGFTPSEIATLRTQFASIHTSRYTPDSMPSPDTLRGLEDAWIDNNAGGLPTGAGGAGGDALEDEFGGLAGVLEVLFRAMVVGFFFPLGSLTWLMREQDIWSKRWQIFVGFGVVFSLTIGLVMGISGPRA